MVAQNGSTPAGRVPVRPGIDVRRAQGRFTTRTGWLDSQHSFAFGHHRDPATPTSACSW